LKCRSASEVLYGVNAADRIFIVTAVTDSNPGSENICLLVITVAGYPKLSWAKTLKTRTPQSVRFNRVLGCVLCYHPFVGASYYSFLQARTLLMGLPPFAPSTHSPDGPTPISPSTHIPDGPTFYCSKHTLLMGLPPFASSNHSPDGPTSCCSKHSLS
jgi:hypothetical protein